MSDHWPIDDWICILEGKESGVARFWLFDKQRQSEIGRYTVSKIMRLSNGKFRRSQSYFFQRPAAIRYATDWLEGRIAKAQQLPKAA